MHIRVNAVSKVTSTMRSRAIRGGLMLMITGLGCATMSNRVRVEPGDAPNKPVFVLSDTTGRGPVGTVYGLSVIPCGTENPVWQLVASGTNGAPSRLVYGDSVTGYISRVGPDPLKPGCYDVYVTDGPRVRFHVDGAGRVEAKR
jgi:hypothetical protein